MRDIMLALHFIGLAMGLGTSFAHAFLGRTVSKLERMEAAKFRLQIKGLSQMGTIGTILLLVSGIYLLIPCLAVLHTQPLLILKLFLFFVLLILILLINRGASRTIKNDPQGNLIRVETMGKIALGICILIVIVAVKVFH